MGGGGAGGRGQRAESRGQVTEVRGQWGGGRGAGQAVTHTPSLHPQPSPHRLFLCLPRSPRPVSTSVPGPRATPNKDGLNDREPGRGQAAQAPGRGVLGTHFLARLREPPAPALTPESLAGGTRARAQNLRRPDSRGGPVTPPGKLPASGSVCLQLRPPQPRATQLCGKLDASVLRGVTPSSLSLEVESSPALTGSKGRSEGQAPLAGEVPLCRVGPAHQGRARARRLQVLGKCVLVDLGPGGGGLGGGVKER